MQFAFQCFHYGLAENCHTSTHLTFYIKHFYFLKASREYLYLHNQPSKLRDFTYCWKQFVYMWCTCTNVVERSYPATHLWEKRRLVSKNAVYKFVCKSLRVQYIQLLLYGMSALDASLFLHSLAQMFTFTIRGLNQWAAYYRLLYMCKWLLSTF